ncbi:MAG: hypothetical protein O7D32_10605 [bacterium]|nr:hypothetical protein [bacterium]
MNQVLRFTVVAVVVAATASCTHYPRSVPSTDKITNLRARYLKDNPEGEFNDRIARGEVTRGMNGIEVLFSWGVPDIREVTLENNGEMWTYYQPNEPTRDYVMYDLYFEDRLLTRWDITRVTAAMGVVTHREFQRPREASLRELTGHTSGGSVKKR